MFGHEPNFTYDVYVNTEYKTSSRRHVLVIKVRHYLHFRKDSEKQKWWDSVFIPLEATGPIVRMLSRNLKNNNNSIYLRKQITVKPLLS